MKLLLIESTPGNAAVIDRELRADGHEIVTCTDEHGGPCRGVAHHAECPLEHHVDLAIVTRDPHAPRSLSEMGSVCAASHRVPLVEVDPTDGADDLPNVEVASALATRRVEAGYATAIRHELGRADVLVDVRRELDRVHVTIQVPASDGSASAQAATADRARHAVREYDQFVRGIDVAVVTYPDPQ